MKSEEDPDKSNIERLKKLGLPIGGTLLVGATGLLSTWLEPEMLARLLLGVLGLLLYVIWHHVITTSRLKTKISKWESRASYPNPPAKILDPLPERIAETQEKILIFMGEIQNGLAATGRKNTGFSTNNIAGILEVGVVTAEVYLNELRKMGYLQNNGPFAETPPWRLSDKGMAYLVEHQLVS